MHTGVAVLLRERAYKVVRALERAPCDRCDVDVPSCRAGNCVRWMLRCRCVSGCGGQAHRDSSLELQNRARWTASRQRERPQACSGAVAAGSRRGGRADRPDRVRATRSRSGRGVPRVWLAVFARLRALRTVVRKYRMRDDSKVICTVPRRYARVHRPIYASTRAGLVQRSTTQNIHGWGGASVGDSKCTVTFYDNLLLRGISMGRDAFYRQSQWHYPPPRY
jgi:hypothetical protein